MPTSLLILSSRLLSVSFRSMISFARIYFRNLHDPARCFTSNSLLNFICLSADISVLPDPWEIVFRTCGLSGDSSSMTWRYPQVRALTAVQVSPIPFMVPDGNEASLRVPKGIPCILQVTCGGERCYLTFCPIDCASC